MKKLLNLLLISGVFGVSLFAAGMSNFSIKQKKEISVLETKQNLLEKRLQCVKSAKSSKDLRLCRKNFPLRIKKIKNKKKIVKN